MEASPTNSYQPPIDKLLSFGECKRHVSPDWPDYLSLGFGPEHVPELIRMATDRELNLEDSESLEVWAPTHAWRTLGQLRAEEAIEPLLELLDELEYDDWLPSELPTVCEMIGPVVLPALGNFLTDPTRRKYARINVTRCIQHIGENWPESRARCVKLLTGQLVHFVKSDDSLNAFLILALVELQAKEAAPLIKRAFDADCVDTMVMGDWDEVQIELGLESLDEIAQEQPGFLSIANRMAYAPVSSLTVRERKVAHNKAKHKMAKQSRKKNRKR